MLLKNKLKKVNEFCVFRGELIWKENDLFFDGKRLYNGDIVLISTLDNIVLIQTESSGTTLIDVINEEQFQIEETGTILSKNLLLSGSWNKDYSSRIIYAFDFRERIKVWECESFFGKPFVFNDVLFGVLKSILFKINPSTGEKLWEFSLSVYGEYFQNGEYHPMDVQKFLGVYKGVLYLIAGNCLILGVDVATGKEVYKFEYTEKVGGLFNTALDTDTGSVFSLGPYHYIEISLENPTCKVFDISESVAKHKLEGERLGSWEKNLIYFWEGSRNNRFGIFDRNKKEIIWSDDIAEVKDHFPAIINVKHGGNKLYVHDINLTLHIFEIDEELNLAGE